MSSHTNFRWKISRDTQYVAEPRIFVECVPERWAYEITTVRAQINNANWLENAMQSRK